MYNRKPKITARKIMSKLKSWKIPENDFTRKHKVTLRFLLTHQAGLPSTNFPQKENAGDPTLVQVLKGVSPAMNKPALVEYIPGTKWQYSNIGFVVIQQILEDVFGKSFTQIALETISLRFGRYALGSGLVKCNAQVYP